MTRAALIFAALLLAQMAPLHAALGLAREAYGVWDREGFHTVANYPYTRGQELDMSWGAVQKGRTSFDWSELTAQLQFAESQNQLFTCKISPIDGSAPGDSMPAWMSATVPFFKESGANAAPYTYGYYLNPTFQTYFREMVQAFAKHLRQEVTPNLQKRIAFVRVDTGATGDESPYENASLVPAQYQISANDWRNYRLWVFEVYRQAFQEGPGPVIPLLFSAVEPPAAQVEWDWVTTTVKGGFGIKHGGQLRGYHLSESQSNVDVYKPLAVDSKFKFFSRNEMDQTWRYSYFQLNLPLSMYWCALEQLNVGMSIWDWSGTCLEGASANGFASTAIFFNKWAAELDPATAGGGFCVFHEGLDSSDTVKFPTATYGAPANQGNTSRYTAICAAYASQGARMDHLEAATWGSVKQRNPPPDGMHGFNDAGWQIHPGNYDRFITQLNPDTTSKALWRINGPLTKSSHPYDRFARSFDHASGKDTMFFNVNESLLPSPGQPVELSVTYLNRGTGQFALQYDAVGNSQKTAFTVTKTNQGDWVTKSVVVTDWAFKNRGPSAADLMLVNVDAEDDIFHGIELIKLTAVNVSTVGQGTVTGRNNAAIYSPLPAIVMEGQRLELAVTPAPGWQFAGWSGDLSGNNTRPFLFPALLSSNLTATFVKTGETAVNTARLSNFSARVAVGGVAGVPIPGFVLNGSGEKAILIRAVGPTLASLDVNGALADPSFTLFRDTTSLSGNDNWRGTDATAIAATGAFALGSNSKDAALLTSLSAGSYTAPVTATDGGNGIALLEVYEAPSTATAVLVNGSTRAYVGTGESVLIPGFVIGGTGTLRLLIRGIGPTLVNFQVPGPLADPTITLYRGSTALATNDNWSAAANAAEIASTAQVVGAFALPTGSRDAAILTTLPPGAYTVVVSGVGATSGTALVELYVVP